MTSTRAPEAASRAQQLNELNTQLTAAQTAKAEAESRLNEAQELRKGGLNSESVPEVLRSPLIAVLKEQLATSERKTAELSASYGARHPALLNARAETANIQGRVAAEVSKIVDGLGREARTANARYDAIAKNFETLKKQMGAVNDRSIQLKSLERDATVNRNLLEAMLLRAKQSTGAETILQANAKLVSPAAPPGAPSYPPKGLIAILGVAGGMMVGAAIALLREGGDHTFRRAEQIEAATGLPVMAVVPQIAGRTPPAMQVLRQPTSAYSEALRRLHIGVELSETVASPKIILFSSATPSEGKSVMVASLGRLLASNGKRVLLIDCDWRSPRLHQIFRCGNRDGLASLLVDKEVQLDQVIHHDALSGVDVMPAGSWSPRFSHLLGSDQMRHLLEALEPHYEFIILVRRPPWSRPTCCPCRASSRRWCSWSAGATQAGSGPRGPEADPRRARRCGRHRDVARAVQAVPPVLVWRPVLRGQATDRCDLPYIGHARPVDGLRAVRSVFPSQLA